MRKYHLGYVSIPLPGDERFSGMVSVPYLSPSGVQCIKFRSFNDGAAKYAQHHGQKGRLYNSPAYFSAGTTIGLSEGEMDAIAATEHLGVPTLGVPGANGWQDQWGALFKDFTRVLIFADGDQAGRDFAARVADAIGWRARIVQCADGEDVSSMVSLGRGDELSDLIRTSNQDEA